MEKRTFPHHPLFLFPERTYPYVEHESTGLTESMVKGKGQPQNWTFPEISWLVTQLSITRSVTTTTPRSHGFFTILLACLTLGDGGTWPDRQSEDILFPWQLSGLCYSHSFPYEISIYSCFSHLFCLFLRFFSSPFIREFLAISDRSSCG